MFFVICLLKLLTRCWISYFFINIKGVWFWRLYFIFLHKYIYIFSTVQESMRSCEYTDLWPHTGLLSSAAVKSFFLLAFVLIFQYFMTVAAESHVSSHFCSLAVLLFSPACLSAWIYFPEHTGGQINIYGECHRSWPGNRGQRTIFFPATISLFCDWWGPRHSHRHQTSGLWDNHRLPAHRQRHSQHSHLIFAHAAAIVKMLMHLFCCF